MRSHVVIVTPNRAKAVIGLSYLLLLAVLLGGLLATEHLATAQL